LQENFEDTKEVRKSGKSKNRQNNDKNKRKGKVYKTLQTKLKDRATRVSLPRRCRRESSSCSNSGLVVLLLNDRNVIY